VRDEGEGAIVSVLRARGVWGFEVVFFLRPLELDLGFVVVVDGSGRVLLSGEGATRRELVFMAVEEFSMVKRLRQGGQVDDGLLGMKVLD